MAIQKNGWCSSQDLLCDYVQACEVVQGECPAFWSIASTLLPSRAPRFLDQSFDLSALRRIKRQPIEQILGGRCGIGGTAGSCKGDRQPETSLMQVGIDGQRALKWADGVGRMAAIRQHQPQIAGDDGVVRFDAFGIAQRCGRRVELALGSLTRGQTEMRIGRGQMRVDGRLKARDRLTAAIRIEQDVGESQVGLRVVRIAGKNCPQRAFERLSLKLARRYLRQPRGLFLPVLGINVVAARRVA